MTESIDRFPVGELPARYGLKSSTTLYARYQAAGVEPFQDGRKRYVTGEALQRLDLLNDCLERGGTLESCAKELPWQDEEIEPLEPHSGLTEAMGESITETPTEGMERFMAAIVGAIVPAVTTSNKKPLDNYRELQDASENGWLLQTAKVAELIEMHPSSLSGKGKKLSRIGFEFERVRMEGGTWLWRVSRSQ